MADRIAVGECALAVWFRRRKARRYEIEKSVSRPGRDDRRVGMTGGAG